MFETLANVARIELTAFLWLMGGVLAWGMLTGRIDTRGLLSGPNNVQLLMTTFVAAGYFLLRVMETHTFPEIPTEMLLLVAGSQVGFTTIHVIQGRITR